jgi:CRISPR/Cas system type I-B associated protein Csh2 (Cas7 group RAMP superfamily)
MINRRLAAPGSAVFPFRPSPFQLSVGAAEGKGLPLDRIKPYQLHSGSLINDAVSLKRRLKKQIAEAADVAGR